MVPYIVVIT